jgi:hypothetical protein
MKSAALQQLVGHIFRDEQNKKEFLSDPESVISKFKLSKQEKQAVLSTHAKLGLVTGNSQHIEIDVGPFSNWI